MSPGSIARGKKPSNDDKKFCVAKICVRPGSQYDVGVVSVTGKSIFSPVKLHP